MRVLEKKKHSKVHLISDKISILGEQPHTISSIRAHEQDFIKSEKFEKCVLEGKSIRHSQCLSRKSLFYAESPKPLIYLHLILILSWQRVNSREHRAHSLIAERVSFYFRSLNTFIGRAEMWSERQLEIEIRRERISCQFVWLFLGWHRRMFVAYNGSQRK